MTVRETLAFVRRHGVVLESARGSVPSLAAHVAGGPIHGSWWGHTRSHEIFRLTRAVRASREILVCRLVAGKITYVHQRLWPALVCVASRFPQSRLAKIAERHTSSGYHEIQEIPFSQWVTDKLRGAAATVAITGGALALVFPLLRFLLPGLEE